MSGIADVAIGRAGDGIHFQRIGLAGKSAGQLTPLPLGHHLVPAPVNDVGRYRRSIQQRLKLFAHVIEVYDRMRIRVREGGNGLSGHYLAHVVDGHAPSRSVARTQPHDGHRQIERLGTEPRYRFQTYL